MQSYKYTLVLNAYNSILTYVGEQYARRFGLQVNLLEHVKNMLEKVKESFYCKQFISTSHNLQITHTMQMSMLM